MYQAVIDPDGSLAFYRLWENGNLAEKASARFYPKELPALVRSLFAHAQNGTGRVSFGNLVDMLAFYRSDKFRNDMERIRNGRE
jgi:hypothetical protein